MTEKVFAPILTEADMQKLLASLDVAAKHIAVQVAQDGAGLNAAAEAGVHLIELNALANKLRASETEKAKEADAA